MTQFMESQNPSSQIVQQGYQAFSNGDMESLKTLMNENVVHIVPGNHPLSGKYSGVDEVLDFYGQLFTLTNDLNIELQDLQPGPNNQVLATHQISAQGNNNLSLNTTENLVFTIENGEITQITQSSMDQPVVDSFWTQVSSSQS